MMMDPVQRELAEQLGFELQHWQRWWINHIHCGGRFVEIQGRRGPRIECTCMNDKRDKRWENIWSSVGEYIWPYEDDEVVSDSPVVEFLIEVVYANTVWYSRILVSENELKEFPDLYKLTLNKMVENIDEMFPYLCDSCLEGQHHACDEPGKCQCTINPDTGINEGVKYNSS